MAIKKSNFACVYMRNLSQYDSGERCGSWVSSLIELIFASLSDIAGLRKCFWVHQIEKKGLQFGWY
jgi:hypothetical protein